MNINERMQNNFIEKQVFAYCKEQKLFAFGDKVIVGVSGGADSVCLLLIMHALREELGIRLYVAHLNHGVRKEAEADAVYVQKLCEELSIPFYQKKVDIPLLAKMRKQGEEVVGRQERYSFFEEVKKETGAGKIVVAHHKNDRAETVLFHLLRGSGIAGLTGIRARRGDVLRPLLCLDRTQIEQYLTDANISYCHDATNDTDDYARNRIRHHLLSYAQKEICEGAIDNICAAATHIERVEEYLLQQTKTAAKRCEIVKDVGESRRVFSIECLLSEHELIRENIIFETLRELSGGGKDIYRTHVEAVNSLIREEGNRFVHLSNCIVASRSYDELTLEKYHQKKEQESRPEIIEISPEELSQEAVAIQMGGMTITLRVTDYDGREGTIPQNGCTKWLDYDKIKDKLSFRTRRIGDYFMMKSGNTTCHKKLKAYLIDEKVPAAERDRLLLLAEGSHILCLLPGRMSEYYKVTNTTKKILQVSIEGEC